jgi:hypothetical protein
MGAVGFLAGLYLPSRRPAGPGMMTSGMGDIAGPAGFSKPMSLRVYCRAEQWGYKNRSKFLTTGLGNLDPPDRTPVVIVEAAS